MSVTDQPTPRVSRETRLLLTLDRVVVWRLGAGTTRRGDAVRTGHRL